MRDGGPTTASLHQQVKMADTPTLEHLSAWIPLPWAPPPLPLGEDGTQLPLPRSSTAFPARPLPEPSLRTPSPRGGGRDFPAEGGQVCPEACSAGDGLCVES